jgi:glycosyltransferase involved in cell wall biosynthesis
VRIAFLHTEGEWSGTTRASAAAARGLIERDHEVSFILPPDSGALDRLSLEGFNIVTFSPDGMWTGGLFRLRRVLRKVDVVFAHSSREQLYTALASWLGARTSIVRRLPAGQQLFVDFALRVACRLAPTSYLFTSAADARRTAVPRGAEAIVADLGVEIEQYPLPENGNGSGVEDVHYVVCHYDPTSRGRTASAIRTLSLLADRHPELHLLIVGAGSDSEDLRMQAAALNILRRVTFLGERSDELDIIRGGHLGWVASDGDDGAFACLDMMALELPVIATVAAVAQRYVANGITGFIVGDGDSQMAAATIAELMASDDRRRAMGIAARARVTREFDEERMIEGFEQAATAAGSGRRRR